MTTLVLILASSSSARAADGPTVDELMRNYRKTFPPVQDANCPPGPDGEIIICARNPNAKERLPLRQEIEGEGARHPDDVPPPLTYNRLDERNRCVSNQNCAKPTIKIVSTHF